MKQKHDLDQIFLLIIQYKQKHDGNSPTFRELMNLTGITSTSVMSYQLERLKKEGLIEVEGKGTSRCLKIVGGKWRYGETSLNDEVILGIRNEASKSNTPFRKVLKRKSVSSVLWS